MPSNHPEMHAFTVLGLGVAGWLLSDELSAEERRLVGTWRLRPDQSGRVACWTFHADRSFSMWQAVPTTSGEIGRGGRWSARGGTIVADPEEVSSAGRSVRSAN